MSSESAGSNPDTPIYGILLLTNTRVYEIERPAEILDFLDIPVSVYPNVKIKQAAREKFHVPP